VICHGEFLLKCLMYSVFCTISELNSYTDPQESETSLSQSLLHSSGLHGIYGPKERPPPN
jgi:hypothetical protein